MSEEPGAEGEQQACLNCEAPLSGAYCAACGQRALSSQVSLGEILREVLSETFELDGRVPRTLSPFVFRPGYLTREYIAGRRARYSSPFRLFLAATLLWLTAGAIADARAEPEGPRVELVQDVQTAKDANFEVDWALAGDPESGGSRWMNEKLQAFVALPAEAQVDAVMDSARENFPSAALLTIPLFAALMKLLFIRRERYYVEHLVFALHVHAFYFFATGVALLISPIGAFSPSLALTLIYTLVAMRRTYERRWWTSAARLTVLIFVHGLMLVACAALLTSIGLLLG